MIGRRPTEAKQWSSGIGFNYCQEVIFTQKGYAIARVSTLLVFTSCRSRSTFGALGVGFYGQSLQCLVTRHIKENVSTLRKYD